MRQSIDIDDFFNNFISEDNEHKVGKIISEYAPNMFKDCTTDYADLRGNGNRKFNLNKIILLYTFIAYRVYNNQHPTDPIAEDDFRRRLRIVSNLVKNSSDEISDSEQRQGGNRLPAIVKQVDNIVINGTVDENIIITPLYASLHLWPICSTKETFTLSNSLSIHLCTRRHHTRRIKLHFNCKSVKIKLSNLYSFQPLKIITSHLPHRELLFK